MKGTHATECKCEYCKGVDRMKEILYVSKLSERKTLCKNEFQNCELVEENKQLKDKLDKIREYVIPLKGSLLDKNANDILSIIEEGNR